MSNKSPLKRFLKYFSAVLLDPLSIYLSWTMLLSYPLLSFLKYKLKEIFASQTIEGQLSLIPFIKIPYLAAPLFVFVIGYWIYNRKYKRFPLKQGRAIKFVFWSSIILIIVNRLLLYLESVRYSNYLYSNYGIDPSGLKFIIVICWLSILTLLPLIPFYKNSSTLFEVFRKKIITFFSESKIDFLFLNPKKQLFFNIFTYCMIAYISFSLLTIASIDSFLDLSQSNLNEKFGYQFEYIEILQKETPENSIIIHPQRDAKWPTIGNQSVLRYFLYPRTLVDGKLFESLGFEKNFTEAIFVEVDDVSMDTHWPKIHFDTKEINFEQTRKIKYSKLEEYRSVEGIKIYKIHF